MTHFYINHNGGQLGPLTIEEVRALKITRSTMAWHEGLPDWLPAGDIPELAATLATPPPLKVAGPPPLKQEPAPPTPQPTASHHHYTPTDTTQNYTTSTDEPQSRILGLKKAQFYVATGIVVLLAIFGIYTATTGTSKAHHEHRAVNAEQSQQLQDQQAAIDAHNKELAEQAAKLEAERVAREEAVKQQRLADLRTQIFALGDQIAEAKRQLDQVNKFQIGRSQSTKNLQLQAIQDRITQLKEQRAALALEDSELSGMDRYAFGD